MIKAPQSNNRNIYLVLKWPLCTFASLHLQESTSCLATLCLSVHLSVCVALLTPHPQQSFLCTVVLQCRVIRSSNTNLKLGSFRPKILALRGASLCCNVLSSCMLTPGTLWFTYLLLRQPFPSRIKDGCLQCYLLEHGTHKPAKTNTCCREETLTVIRSKADNWCADGKKNSALKILNKRFTPRSNTNHLTPTQSAT